MLCCSINCQSAVAFPQSLEHGGLCKLDCPTKETMLSRQTPLRHKSLPASPLSGRSNLLLVQKPGISTQLCRLVCFIWEKLEATESSIPKPTLLSRISRTSAKTKSVHYSTDVHAWVLTLQPCLTFTSQARRPIVSASEPELNGSPFCSGAEHPWPQISQK